MSLKLLQPIVCPSIHFKKSFFFFKKVKLCVVGVFVLGAQQSQSDRYRYPSKLYVCVHLHICAYVSSFSDSFPLRATTRCGHSARVASSPLFVCYMHSSVHVLISPLICPSPHLFVFRNDEFVFCVCESIFALKISSLLSFC